MIEYSVMDNSFVITIKVDYTSPTLRIITTNLEMSFLASNLEPIDGGEDPDIDW